jgi:CRP-like cAMP-binding protein
VEVLDVSGDRVLATLGRGSCVGEMALLQPHGRRSATVRVAAGGSAATCLALGRAHFQALLVAPVASTTTPPRSAAAAADGAALLVAALQREKRLRALEQVRKPYFF